MTIVDAARTVAGGEVGVPQSELTDDARTDGGSPAFHFEVGVNFLSSEPVPRMEYVHTLVPTAERLDRLNGLRTSLGYKPLTFDEFVGRCASEQTRLHSVKPVWIETKASKVARRLLRVVRLDRVLPPDPEEIESETLKFGSLAELQTHLAECQEKRRSSNGHLTKGTD